MRSRVGVLIVLLYVAIVAAAVLAVGCGDDEPTPIGNTPNLVASDLVFAVDRAALGEGVSVARTLRNNGTTDAQAFVVEYYLSEDGVLDPGADFLAATETLGGLAAGAEETGACILACPGSPGEFHCIASIDPADDVYEIDESDNLSVSAGLVRVCTLPNLRAEGTAVVSPAPVTRAGLALDVAASLAETEGGLDVEDAFRVTTFLSEDDVIDPATDLPLGAGTAGPIAAGAGATVPTTVALPEITPAGRWYLGSFVDDTDAVAELCETDNIDPSAGVAAIDVLAPALSPGEVDLVAHDSRAALVWNGSSYELASGSRLLCLVDCLSMGEPPAGTFRIGIYFSENDALTTSDLLVGSALVSAAEIARGSVPIECQAPASPAGTTYYWGAIVDDLGVVAETDETNNSHRNWALEIVSEPAVDLVAASMNEGPPIMALEIGVPRSVNFSLVCAGSAESGYFTVKLYASSDDEITGAGDDFEIGYKWFKYLPAGYFSEGMGRPEWATVELPPGAAPGQYRIGCVVDVYDQVAESDETNNAMVYPAPVSAVDSGAPDLVVVMHDISRPETAGPLNRHAEAGVAEGVWPLVTVGNYGTRAATAAPVGIYAAPARAANPAGDVLLATIDTGALEPGAFRKHHDVALDLSPLGEGTHFLYACIDPAGAVAEGDETNNTSDHLEVGAFEFGGWVTLVVSDGGPDLAARAVPDAGAYTVGGRLWLDWEVVNTCLTTPAAPSGVTLWLSRDAGPAVSPGDVGLASDAVGRLVPGGRFSKHVGLVIPGTPDVAAPYRIKAMADSVCEIAEADETNNVSASAEFTFVTQP